MQIGLVIYGSLDTLSGGYLYDRWLVRALHAAGHQVTLYQMPWRSYGHHLTDNLNPQWRRRLLSAPVDLWLQDELNHPSLCWLNRQLRRRHPAPIASIVHHLRSTEEHPPPLLPLYRTVERAYLNTLDACLANSHTTAAYVHHLLARPIPCQVAWPAANHLPDPTPFDAAALATRARHPGPLRILFVGNLIPRKGLHHLLQALAAVPAPWQLSVVGGKQHGDPYTKKVERQMAELGLARQVHFLGRVSDSELVDCYTTHHLLAMPSFEGFGIAFLEAQRFGLPVVAFDTGAVREVILPEQTGLLVPPHDRQALAQALTRLAQQRELLLALGLAARLRYSLHPTWEQSMNTAVRWLESLPSHKKTG